MSFKKKIVITTAKRTTHLLESEIKRLGYKIHSVGKAEVIISGNLRDCIILNMHLRTAHKVLYHIETFRANRPQELYDCIMNISWEDYIEKEGYFCVNSHVFNETIRDSRFANLKVKDAIVDRMQKVIGKRPNSGPDKSNTSIFLYWINDQCSVYFDTSGETIAKHGYRKIPFKAPLLESLASSIIYTTCWKPSTHFINPMCGSGTLAIEAALIGLNIVPGMFRENFGFMHIKSFHRNDWKEIRKMARSKERETLNFKIIASDTDGLALGAARKNAQTAGVEHLIEFQKCDFTQTTIPEGDGIVILNPEYGERMGSISELENTYREIGDFFKKQCNGKTGYVFTGNLGLGKKIGLKTKRKIEFYNGKIDCRLLEYELYQGTKKNQ